MSKLKLSPNLFLEVNELKKLVDFIDNDGYKLIFKQLIKEFGISQNAENTMFKVSHKTGTDNIVTINPGIAIDSNINVINLPQSIDIEIPHSEKKQWITISYSTTNDEVGLVNISPQGNLSGTGTQFLSVLRGQPNFPTKVKFSSNNNTEEYEVVDVTSDTEATLSGVFVDEKELKYQVIGTFTPGYQPDDNDKFIYEYDSCMIHIIDSEDKPIVSENTFIIACVDFENGINVIDERTNIFNNESQQEVSDTIINTNPFVSLLRVQLFNNILDLQMEWGYKINKYKLNATSTSNIIRIINGGSNYIPSIEIPDNIFNGWKLLNRKNMVYSIIDYNKSNSLYISTLSSSLITNTDDDDFVIVPDFNEIEVQTTVSGSNYNDDDTQYYHRFSILNQKSRFQIPIEWLDTSIKLQYRMIDSDKTTIFQNFAITQFININKEKETLGNSSFSININEPIISSKRNYS
jgi:hypothetical protein